MKNLQTFEEFLNESYEIISDKGTRNLSKIDSEILQLALKGLPKNVTDSIESVEGHGSWTQTFETPANIKNSSGAISYNYIELIFNKPIGKMTKLLVGLRKRTSGPGTGYIMLRPGTGTNSPFVNISLIKSYYGAVATEFYYDPIVELKELYDKQIKPLL